MNGRLYDPLLHRFLQPDNNIQDPLNSQNYNRYGYAWNNPLRYSDPSGEIIWFVVGLAVIGGTINLATNIAQGNITGSFWEKVGKGLAAFGAGAASGALSIYGPVGWAAGGVIMGGTNAWLAGQDPLQGMMIGGLSGLAGGYLGKWMAPAINNIVVNGIQVSSPMLAGAISGSIGGAAIGGAMGGTMSLIQGGSFGDGFAQGFSTGALSGFVSGAGGGYLSAKANNVNPLSGKSKTPIQTSPTYDLTPNPNGDNVKLYRGTTGSENDNGPLFMTDNPDYAATYVKNGGSVVEVTVPRFTLAKMQFDGYLTKYNGMHGNSGGTEYQIHPIVKKQFVNLFKK
jgi:hypothetical protein